LVHLLVATFVALRGVRYARPLAGQFQKPDASIEVGGVSCLGDAFGNFRSVLGYSRHGGLPGFFRREPTKQFFKFCIKAQSTLARRWTEGWASDYAVSVERRADQPFALGRSPRISRNSCGPFKSRRFRLARSSAGADRSSTRSIARPAISDALDPIFLPSRSAGCAAGSPSSTSRRIASARGGKSDC
jgi:hypothetical protein